MKSGWANGLRGIVALAILSGVATTRAQTPQSSSSSAEPAEQPIVVATRVVAQDGRVLSEPVKGINVEIGKPLDRTKVAQSLRLLYKTGDYSDLRAVLTTVPGGVRLDFVARENLFFNQVLIDGLVPPPSEASAVAATQLNLGQTFRAALVDEAAERLRDTLRQEGLYTAEIKAETVPHPETHQIDVIFHIKSGPRARVGTIQLKNDTQYPDVEILKRLKMKPGRPITSARLQSGTDRIRKYLVKKGNLIARAVVRRGTYTVATNTISLDLEVSQGPGVKLQVVGAKFSKGELKRLVPVYQKGGGVPALFKGG